MVQILNFFYAIMTGIMLTLLVLLGVYVLMNVAGKSGSQSATSQLLATPSENGTRASYRAQRQPITGTAAQNGEGGGGSKSGAAAPLLAAPAAAEPPPAASPDASAGGVGRLESFTRETDPAPPPASAANAPPNQGEVGRLESFVGGSAVDNTISGATTGQQF